ncbi:MAG: hypothetical protein Q4A65_02655 [Bacillota bacterium]|nr:hypothetical protein [Bacillota bacterium]
MSFRNNGRKRDPKYLISGIFMLLIGIVSLLLAARSGWKFSWTVIGAVVTFLSILMIKNANE